MSYSDENRDKDIKIGKLLQLPYETKFLVMDKKGDGSFINFERKGQADWWLAGELEKRPNGHCEGAYVEEMHYYPQYSRGLGQAELIINEMGKRGFYVKIHGRFRLDLPCFVSFELHGYTDTNPLWESSSVSPAEAVVLAAIKCIEGNPEVFKAEEAAHV